MGGFFFFFFWFCFQGVNSTHPLKASISAWLTNVQERKTSATHNKTTHMQQNSFSLEEEMREKNNKKKTSSLTYFLCIFTVINLRKTGQCLLEYVWSDISLSYRNLKVELLLLHIERGSLGIWSECVLVAGPFQTWRDSLGQTYNMLERPWLLAGMWTPLDSWWKWLEYVGVCVGVGGLKLLPPWPKYKCLKHKMRLYEISGFSLCWRALVRPECCFVRSLTSVRLQPK